MHMRVCAHAHAHTQSTYRTDLSDLRIILCCELSTPLLLSRVERDILWSPEELPGEPSLAWKLVRCERGAGGSREGSMGRPSGLLG